MELDKPDRLSYIVQSPLARREAVIMSIERRSLPIDTDPRRNPEPRAKPENRSLLCPTAQAIETMLCNRDRKRTATRSAATSSAGGAFYWQATTQPRISSWGGDPEFLLSGPETTDASRLYAGASTAAKVLFFIFPRCLRRMTA